LAQNGVIYPLREGESEILMVVYGLYLVNGQVYGRIS
jgi:hypothetical protein